MKILLLQVDKTQDSYIAEGTEIYHQRLLNYCTFQHTTINMPKEVRQRSIPEQKKAESVAILKVLKPGDVLVLLDERGKEYNSNEFASFLRQRQNSSVKQLVFLIGGPFGFDEEIYNRANFRLSLSKMTFSHQMVRLFFAEQLYRAFTILKGEKYHHN